MKIFITFLIIFIFIKKTCAQTISWNGFVDTYYNQSNLNPKNNKRSYTTQPVKNNQGSVNLAMIGVNIEDSHYRGKFIIQDGDSVKANYALEPQDGFRLEHLQETYFGVKIGENLWFDGGIYIGNIGMESWISKDNYNYSRALMLDYVPYYSSGLRLSGKNGIDDWQIHLMNGWQNISENNSDKAMGAQYVKRFSDWNFIYNNFFGNELDLNSEKKKFSTRTYHDFIIERPGTIIGWKMALDIGTQFYSWQAMASEWQYRFHEFWALGFRAEYFRDPKGVIATTGTKHGFEVTGATLNLDWRLSSKILNRLELRSLQSRDKIYPSKNNLSNNETILIASMGITI